MQINCMFQRNREHPNCFLISVFFGAIFCVFAKETANFLNPKRNHGYIAKNTK